jgi:hypothetical protein
MRLYAAFVFRRLPMVVYQKINFFRGTRSDIRNGDDYQSCNSAEGNRNNFIPKVPHSTPSAKVHCLLLVMCETLWLLPISISRPPASRLAKARPFSLFSAETLKLSHRRKIRLIKWRTGAYDDRRVNVEPLHRRIRPAWPLVKLHGAMDVLHQWLVRAPFLRVQQRRGSRATKRHRNYESSKSSMPRAQPVTHGCLSLLWSPNFDTQHGFFTGHRKSNELTLMAQVH